MTVADILAQLKDQFGKEIDKLKDDLGDGKVLDADYRRYVGMIRGLRMASQIVAELKIYEDIDD